MPLQRSYLFSDEGAGKSDSWPEEDPTAEDDLSVETVPKVTKNGCRNHETADENCKGRKRKEIINKHQAKNMKTNFLQAKSSREQFHVIRCSAALAYKVRQSDRLSEVSIFLINQLSHSQRNFRHWSCTMSENTSPSPSAVSTETRDWQNQGRINEELLYKHPWEGEVKAERNCKQKAKHGLLVGHCSRNQRETGHKNWNSFIHPTSILRQSWGSKEKVFTTRFILLAPAL